LTILAVTDPFAATKSSGLNVTKRKCRRLKVWKHQGLKVRKLFSLRFKMTIDIWCALNLEREDIVHLKGVQLIFLAVTDPFAATKSSGLKSAKRRKKHPRRIMPNESKPINIHKNICTVMTARFGLVCMG